MRTTKATGRRCSRMLGRAGFAVVTLLYQDTVDAGALNAVLQAACPTATSTSPMREPRLRRMYPFTVVEDRRVEPDITHDAVDAVRVCLAGMNRLGVPSPAASA